MHTVLNVFLIILTIVVVLLAVLYFVGRRLQKKQAVQQEQMEAAKQTVSMLVIDKKKLKMKEAGLPQMVLDSTPKIMRRTKLPIVKAKVGPRIMTFIADAKVFEMIPVKKEVNPNERSEYYDRWCRRTGHAFDQPCTGKNRTDRRL